jgi:hypothetical protein
MEDMQYSHQLSTAVSNRQYGGVMILLAYSPAGVAGPQAPKNVVFPVLVVGCADHEHRKNGVSGGLRPPDLPFGSLPAVSCYAGFAGNNTTTTT